MKNYAELVADKLPYKQMSILKTTDYIYFY